MVRKRKLAKTKPSLKNQLMQAKMEEAFNQSIKKLKANERDIERAIKKVLTNEELKVSEAEFNEIKELIGEISAKKLFKFP